MSRSRKRTPIGGWTTAPSEKWEKRKANRKRRRIHRELVAKIVDAEDEPTFPSSRELESNWTWGKDGKGYFGDSKYFDPAWMRK